VTNDLASAADFSYRVVLVGVGVVGREIARQHLRCGFPITLVDQNEIQLEQTAKSLLHEGYAQSVERVANGVENSHWLVTPNCVRWTPANKSRVLVIESIAERIDAKQACLRLAQEKWGLDAILCSNTSTLRIETIGAQLRAPQQLCGMHFFVPVEKRLTVEVIRSTATDETTYGAVIDHVRRLERTPLSVRDTPGFVVNRMLAPYLNQAMLLLCDGVSPEEIETAALQYGMPLSPLELIDWIGTRTTFDAGRVYWQAFPKRMDPSPLIAALVKAARAGKVNGCGFYNYVQGHRSSSLAPESIQLAAKYQRTKCSLTSDDIIDLLTIPMWIEAHLIMNQRVVSTWSDIEVGMSGGLGYKSPHGWRRYFQSLGDTRIESAIDRWASKFRSMTGLESRRQPPGSGRIA
jgi:3-hydroxyacyl-CoA dehydrogenase